MNENGAYCSPEGKWQGFRKPDGVEFKPLGVIAIATAIKDMGALSVLSLRSNNLQAAGGKALAEGLKGNQVITELNIANNNLGLTSGVGYDMSGVIALADVIPNMGALLVLSLKGNALCTAGGGQAICQILKNNNVLADLDISDNYGGAGEGPSGSVALAKGVAEGVAGNGAQALTKLGISSNNIAAAPREDLQRICAASGIELAK
jgi:hypothetical protein